MDSITSSNTKTTACILAIGSDKYVLVIGYKHFT